MSNNTDSKSSLENKRAQFTKPGKTQSPVKIIGLIAFALLILATGYFAMNRFAGKSTTTAVAKTPDEIKISLSDLDGGKAQFLTHQLASNMQVRFFAVKSPDGKYRAAMDACETCFHAKKGYHQEGNAMICNKCGMAFQSNMINEVKGGCHPIGVPCTVEDNQLVIKTSELESRGSYFQ
jgi:uncharacterized membrane protein